MLFCYLFVYVLKKNPQKCLMMGFCLAIHGKLLWHFVVRSSSIFALLKKQIHEIISFYSLCGLKERERPPLELPIRSLLMANLQHQNTNCLAKLWGQIGQLIFFMTPHPCYSQQICLFTLLITFFLSSNIDLTHFLITRSIISGALWNYMK